MIPAIGPRSPRGLWLRLGARIALAIAALAPAGCMTLGSAVVAVPAAVAAASRVPATESADPPGTLATPRPLAGEPRVAVALGGGSLRGFAHVGVIAALEEAGIRPSLVVGTSAGSVIGALWASGLTAAQIDQATRELDWGVLADIGIPRRGLVGGGGIEAFVSRHVNGRAIEDLPVPFAAVATDALSGDPVLLNRGSTASAVRASSSIPVVFEPIRARGRLLLDGGLSAPTPVRLARQLGADIVIAVNVAWSPEEAALHNPVDMLFQTMQLMGHNLNRAELAQADVVIAPDIRSLGPIGRSSRDGLIGQGVNAGRDAVPAIGESIRAWRSRHAVIPGKTDTAMSTPSS
jgi:NTE family protein